jgi:hypothetical protein
MDSTSFKEAVARRAKGDEVVCRIRAAIGNRYDVMQIDNEQ